MLISYSQDNTYDNISKYGYSISYPQKKIYINIFINNYCHLDRKLLCRYNK